MTSTVTSTVTATPTTTPTTTPTPTPTPTLTASPVDSCNNAVVLGVFQAGQSVSDSGVSVGSSSSWFQVSAATIPVTLTLASSGSPASSGVVMDVDTNCAGASAAAGVTSFTGTAETTYFVRVYEGSGATDGGYTITAGG